jgi:hypothetical protein
MIRTSAQPEAEKPEEEQHHNAQLARTQFSLALPYWLLFELWGFTT